MPKLVDVPFAAQEGNSGVIQNSNETLINMYVEVPTSGRAQIIRRQRPCLRNLYMISGEKRAIEHHKGLHYCIIGPTLYSFDGTNLLTLGSLGTSSGRCTIIFNDLDEIMISDGTSAYYWDGATLTLVTLPGGLQPGTLAYLGGFGVTNNVGTGQFFSTASNDFSAFGALDFATAEADPGPLYRVLADHNELWLAGEHTIEIWQMSGNGDFPFQPVMSAKIERGTAAKFSFASEDNTVVWLGDDKIVYRGDGYRPFRISTQPIEEAIRGVSAAAVTNANAFLFAMGGHKFYVLTFPDELTIMFNLSTGLWSRAKSPGSESWNVVGSAGKNTDHVLTPTGICELTPDLNEDEGESVIRTARSAPGYADGALITLHELFVDCEVGRADLGEDAEIMLRVARDGETFGNIRVRDIGATGEYSKRAVWRGLGQGRRPVFEISASGNYRLAIMGTKLNATVAST